MSDYIQNTQLPSSASPGILRLPLELLHDIFALLSPEDFLSCRRSCSHFLHSSESANLFSAILHTPCTGKSLSNLKRQLFHDAAQGLPPFERVRRGLGPCCRSTVSLQLAETEAPKLHMSDDATIFAVSFKRVVYLYRSLDCEPSGNPYTSKGYLATQPTLLSAYDVNSPVVAFYTTRGRPLWGHYERPYCLLAHKNGCFTLLGTNLGTNTGTRPLLLRNPCKTQWSRHLNWWRLRCTAAAMHSEMQTLAFLCDIGVAVYCPLTLCSSEFAAPRLTYWVSLPAKCPRLEVFLIAPGLTSLTFYVTGRVLLIPGRKICGDTSVRIIHPELGNSLLRRCPGAPPTRWAYGFLGMNSASTVFPHTSHTGDEFLFTALEGGVEDATVGRVFPRWTGRIHHPPHQGAANVTEHCAVLLESRNYLLAVRYADGEIWLFEYDVPSAAGVQEMAGTFLGREQAATKIGFAVRLVTGRLGSAGMRPLVALVVVTEDFTVVTWQLSAIPTWKSAVVSVSDVKLVRSVKVVKDVSVREKIKALILRR